MGSNVLRRDAGNGHAILDNGNGRTHHGVTSRKLAGATLFARNFFSHPRMLGSIIPSSRFLVRRLLNEIDWERARTIVEFGPGIGNISSEILARLRPDGRLIVFETNPNFVQYLRSQFTDPRFIVAATSAEQVCSVLNQHGITHADHVISGIPFSVMPAQVRDAVLEQTYAILGSTGSMLIYQFSPAVKASLQRVFGDVRHDFEWLNVLPAHVFFARSATGSLRAQ